MKKIISIYGGLLPFIAVTSWIYGELLIACYMGTVMIISITLTIAGQ